MSIQNLQAQRTSNVFKTWFLMSLFIAIISAIGLFLAYTYNNPSIFYGAIVFSIVMNIASYWFSDKVALSMSGAKEINKTQYPEFWSVAENLASSANIPMPKLYVINDPIPNAFATGRNKNNSAVAATTGILSMLSKTELEGVIAHELSHIKNRDILLSTVVVIMVSAITFLSQMFRFGSVTNSGDGENRGGLLSGLISILAIILAPIAATIIQLSISRKREFMADAGAAILTKNPEGLASALQKISQFRQPLSHANNATAHMYIVNPMGLNAVGNSNENIPWFAKLFMTHPPTNERIKALLGTTKIEEAE